MKNSNIYLSIIFLICVCVLDVSANAANCPDVTDTSQFSLENLEVEINELPDLYAQRVCRRKWINYLRADLSSPTATMGANSFDSTPSSGVLIKSDVLSALENDEATDNKKVESQEKFSDLGFGIGVGYSFGSGGNRIEEAEYVNDVLRVKSDNTDQARVLLEAHWFFVKPDSNFGHGPFASINTGGSEEAIGSFALGYMIGFRDRDVDSKASWNLGVGYIVDSNVQVLGDDLVANQQRPEGETEVRFNKKSKGGIVVIFSRGF